jgi:hypothetical protein
MIPLLADSTIRRTAHANGSSANIKAKLKGSGLGRLEIRLEIMELEAI